MIIDAYNNTWQAGGTSDYLTAESYTPETMIRHMDEAGVDKAVGCSLGQMIDNDFIAETVEQSRGRVIGFGQVDPRKNDAVQVVNDVARLGLKGLKLHPTMHGYHFADHGLLDPVFTAAADNGLTVLVNALDDPFCAPFSIEEISKAFPNVPLLIAHMGTVWNVTEAMIVAERNEHIYLETSGTQLIEVQMAYRRLGAEKLVMGTDWPGNHFDLERAKIARAIPDADDRALVEGLNLGRILGIS
ncbi:MULTISPECIES: amidohydrolase family protein [unclassified Leucobacter]|uniref:amidohydrolase family protein n=1 Tax=unclassified Leucobacter TaxID=2621730 RepID=UPI00165DF269|nr:MULTISPECIES: amidohydrolase family protein [unclassified Leucobacter]MBC9935841.1 amidohydrolase family protein [Leucobacter sp. cx-87]